VQQKLTAADAELQELQKRSNTVTHQEQQALREKSRAARNVQLLQVGADPGNVPRA
jgi:hypothetical protein